MVWIVFLGLFQKNERKKENFVLMLLKFFFFIVHIYMFCPWKINWRVSFIYFSWLGLQEWKRISCFRHEDFSSEPQKSPYIEHPAPEEVIKSETQKSEYIEHYGAEEAVKSECNNSSAVKRNLPSNLREVALGFMLQVQMFDYFFCCRLAFTFVELSDK